MGEGKREGSRKGRQGCRSTFGDAVKTVLVSERVPLRKLSQVLPILVAGFLFDREEIDEDRRGTMPGSLCQGANVSFRR